MTTNQLICIFLLLPFSLLAQSNTNYSGQYDWANPSASMSISDELMEISGLTYVPNSSYLFAIQDELGTLFMLDKESGRTVQQIPFWKEGDYEGVEWANGNVYVVKSSGTIYEVVSVGTVHQSVLKFNGFLGSDNDIEGFAYDAKNQQLLLACKAEPGDEIDPNRFKAIYSFDLRTKVFSEEPLILLDRHAFDAYLRQCTPGPNHTKLCDIFDPEKEDFDLNPTALAIHPITGHFYLTSSKGNLLLIIDRGGNIMHIHKLPKNLHRQPEGLCFDEQGNLYISNEQKKDSPAVIHYYTYDPNRR